MFGVLNPEPDGMGFFYGFHRCHRVDIRYEPFKTRPGSGWSIYVDGELVMRDSTGLQNAEHMATHYIDVVLETTPPPC